MRADQRESEADLRQLQVSYSALSRQFVLILILATAIASLGLLADSAVAIVGAMLIAPLMKPIMALAYGLVSGDPRLQLRAVLTLCVGVVITVLVAGLTEQFIEMRGPTSQIMARTQPSLIDLGIAVAAGVAAAMAAVRRNVSDTLPGVAIAVALVPPLCVSGIGFSIGAESVGLSAALLFAVNLVAIVLAASIVFLADGYGSVRRAWLGLLLSLVVACLLSVPLTTTLRELRADDRAQEAVESYLHEQFRINGRIHPNDLARLGTQLFTDHVFVFVELRSPSGGLTERQLNDMHAVLAAMLELPVNLKVQFLLTEEMRLYAHPLPDGMAPDYGADDLVERR